MLYEMSQDLSHVHHSGTLRSWNAVLQATTRGFSWSRGTQLRTVQPSNKLTSPSHWAEATEKSVQDNKLDRM